MKTFILISLCLLVITFGLTACSINPKVPVPCCTNTKIPSEKNLEPIQNSRKPDIQIIAVGDIMLGTNYPDDRLAPNDGAHLLKSVTPVLQAADITFGNLEGVLMEGGIAAKKCKNPISCYVFRSPPHYARYLKAAGFDVLSLANNHARDFGEEGRTATMQTLDEAGLLHSGRFGDVARWQVKGVTISLIAFAPFGGSHDLLDIPLAKALIEKEVSLSDLVLVSIHAGAEGKNVAHIPFKNEMFYGEDRGDVVAFSHAVIDAGADLVVGHGPHVSRAMEIYKGRLIAYSLGNFTTYQGINIRDENGLAPILNVTISPNGQFKHGRVISAKQYRPQGTRLDNSHGAAKIIKNLTQEDFPNTGLEITEHGKIHLKTIPIDNSLK